MRNPSLEKMHRDAHRIFQAALKAADPAECIRRNLRLSDSSLEIGTAQYKLDDLSQIIVVGAGKATVAMAEAVEGILGEHISCGFINTKYGHSKPLERVQVNECGHPIPDSAGVGGTERILELLSGVDERALVLCLVSGGGSALMPCPAEGITLTQKQETTRLLLECGATINELNAIRKHLSRVKGGGLARAAYPAKLAALILSDVIGDPLDVIASGPTVPDSSTFADCIEIIRKYGLGGRIPREVNLRLSEGTKGKIEETPKEGDDIFANCQSLVIGGNRLAVEAAQKEAFKLGYNVLILSTRIEGEAKEVAKVYAAVAKEIATTGNPLPRPACVISGGETTVTVHGGGKGGRNQEFALASAVEIEGWDDVVIFSAGTDGTDGPTDAAGAIADGRTVRRAIALGMSPSEFLDDNDSYHFFQALDDLVITGPTGTNVMDIQLVLVS